MDIGAAVRKPMLGVLGFLLAAPMFAAGLASAQVADKKPNIVLVLMDNLGWGEPGVYGGGILRGAATPRIDRLAAEGMPCSTSTSRRNAPQAVRL
jgi:Sulfatase